MMLLVEVGGVREMIVDLLGVMLGVQDAEEEGLLDGKRLWWVFVRESLLEIDRRSWCGSHDEARLATEF